MINVLGSKGGASPGRRCKFELYRACTAEDMTSCQLRMLRIFSSRARVWMVSESLSSLDWIVRSGRSGLLAEDSGHQDLGRGECALGKGYGLPMRTVIPAD